jgi:exopolyphosphatase/guanosine-5'-triphosphate,3'-diphosphate pyrophosphatase
MPTFAAVDIGANSVRLKIAQLIKGRLKVLHEDREVTRLGQSVFSAGILSSNAMAHTIRVLQRFYKSTQSFGVHAVRVAGTSPLRDARNSNAFVDWVRSATGWHVEIITGLEEGRLIHLAVMSASRMAHDRALLIDLGGGSCELTVSDDGKIKQMFSLPLGAVRLTQEFLPHDPPKKKEVERLEDYISEEVERVRPHIQEARPADVVATSGTAAALAALATASTRPTSAPVPARAVLKLSRDLAKLNLQQRASLRGIGPRRSEIIIAGATVYAELLSRLELSKFRFSPLGLRDGLIAQMASDYDSHTRFRSQIVSQRQNAVLDIGKHFGVDLRYAERIRSLCMTLFEGLQRVHQLPGEYKDWLTAAAMLQEVGSYINRSGRRRHAYYIISNSEIFGYSVHQRQVIAAITRYVGRSRPEPESRPMRPLTAQEHALVPKAVMLLRLARALDQSRHGVVTGLKFRVKAGTVTLKLTTKRGGADLELWSLEKESGYFREVFGRELVTELS